MEEEVERRGREGEMRGNGERGGGEGEEEEERR